MFFKSLGATSCQKLIWSKFRVEDPHILGATIENLVVQATWCLVFVHPALHKYCYGDRVRDDLVCSICGRGMKCFQNFCQVTLEKETTGKT